MFVEPIKIEIIDNSDWNPDLDFYVELCDATTMKRLPGDDTRTRVTILDEDFPGTLSFKETDVTCTKAQGFVEITILRSEGTDGQITCEIKTHPLVEGTPHQDNAVEYEDYQPTNQVIVFENGESQKDIKIELVNERPHYTAINEGKDDIVDENKDDEEQEEEIDKKFKIKFEFAKPE